MSKFRIENGEVKIPMKDWNKLQDQIDDLEKRELALKEKEEALEGDCCIVDVSEKTRSYIELAYSQLVETTKIITKDQAFKELVESKLEESRGVAREAAVSAGFMKEISEATKRMYSDLLNVLNTCRNPFAIKSRIYDTLEDSMNLIKSIEERKNSSEKEAE